MAHYVPQSDRYKTLQVVTSTHSGLTAEEVITEVIRVGGQQTHVKHYLREFVRKGLITKHGDKYISK